AEVGVARVRGGDRDRDPPRPRHPDARGPGLHDPVRLDDGHAARRRLHPREQIPLRRGGAVHPLAHAGPPQPTPGRHHRVQVPARRAARLHQADHRDARRPDPDPRPPGVRERQIARRALYEVRRRRALGAGRLLRLRLRLRADARAARFLLRHGGQPRQLSGQSLLGVRQARQDQGQGVPDLLVVGRRPLLAPLVATGPLYPLTGAERPAPTVGGPRQARPGSARADTPLGSILADNPPAADTLGFYIHVPFCAQRCHYCSFNTAPLDASAMTRYLAALGRELELLGALPWAPRVRIETVFFGGGTPSLLDPAALAEILARLRRRFPVAPGAEIT